MCVSCATQHSHSLSHTPLAAQGTLRRSLLSLAHTLTRSPGLLWSLVLSLSRLALSLFHSERLASEGVAVPTRVRFGRRGEASNWPVWLRLRTPPTRSPLGTREPHEPQIDPKQSPLGRQLRTPAYLFRPGGPAALTGARTPYPAANKSICAHGDFVEKLI